MHGTVYKGQEVFTIGQVCEVLRKDKETVKSYVKNHKAVFVEGIDYYKLSKADVMEIRKRLAGTDVYRFYATNPNNVRAYTQAGIDKLAKIYKVPGHVVSALEKAVEVFGSESTADARAIEDVIRFNNEMVDGRSLHEFLGVKTRYNDWFPRMVEAGDFIEGEDYYSNLSKEIPLVDNSMNHDLTMDMAKEICMLQHNERGKQARRYFIECEKRLKASQPSYMIEDRRARALAWVAEMEAKDKEMAQLKANNAVQAQIIGEMRPKADYMDIILKSNELLTITQIAKDYGMGGGEMNDKLHDYGIQYKQNGEWLLYSKYQAKGYTHSSIYELPNGNTKTYMKWTQKGRMFIYNFLKEKGIVPTIEKDMVLFN